MNIVILLRFPKVENSPWKRELIERLLDQGYTVSVFFGESSYWCHLKAALKQYGINFYRRNKGIVNNCGPRLVKALKRKLPILRVYDLNSKKTEKLLYRLQPDLILLLGTGIIRKNILEVPKKGTIHCHQGYLPKFRGVNTIEWSIFFEQDVYISTHFVSPGIDTGDIILRKKIDLKRLHTIAGVRERCKEEALDLLIETISGIKDNRIESIPQSKKDGKQYFAMHPLFLNIVERKLQENR